MPKATVVPGKKTAAVKKPSASRVAIEQNHEPEIVETEPLPVEATPSALPSDPDPLLLVHERLNAIEEKIASGFAALAAEIHARTTVPPMGTPVGDVTTDATLPLLTDVFRRQLMEQMSPVTAGMKRLEERIGFVANRLKHGGSNSGGSSSGGGGGGGPERPKPWRNEPARHARPRGGGQQNGQPRQPQGQPPPSWTPPSAASVQGHFAPRPLPGRGFIEEEE